jgi:hypothetical protein
MAPGCSAWPALFSRVLDSLAAATLPKHMRSGYTGAGKLALVTAQSNTAADNIAEALNAAGAMARLLARSPGYNGLVPATALLTCDAPCPAAALCPTGVNVVRLGWVLRMREGVWPLSLEKQVGRGPVCAWHKAAHASAPPRQHMSSRLRCEEARGRGVAGPPQVEARCEALRISGPEAEVGSSLVRRRA